MAQHRRDHINSGKVIDQEWRPAGHDPPGHALTASDSEPDGHLLAQAVRCAGDQLISSFIGDEDCHSIDIQGGLHRRERVRNSTSRACSVLADADAPVRPATIVRPTRQPRGGRARQPRVRWTSRVFCRASRSVRRNEPTGPSCPPTCCMAISPRRSSPTSSAKP